MMRGGVRLLLVLVVSWAVAADSANDGKPPSEVVVLQEDNFNRLTSEGTWFINFYAPWCGHCKRVMPVWEQVAAEMKGSGVRFGKIDADSETDLAEKFRIKAYPTFKMFDGGKTTDFQGEHTKDSFIKFAKEVYESRGKSRARSAGASRGGGQWYENELTDMIRDFAAESFWLYTGIVWGMGCMSGVLWGVIFATREKDNLAAY